MNAIEKAKLEYETLLKQEQVNKLTKDLEILKNQLEGKCFATETLVETNNFVFEAVNYKNFFIESESIYCDLASIKIIEIEQIIKNAEKLCSREIKTYEGKMWVSGDFTKINSAITHRKLDKEITKENFENLIGSLAKNFKPIIDETKKV